MTKPLALTNVLNMLPMLLLGFGIGAFIASFASRKTVPEIVEDSGDEAGS